MKQFNILNDIREDLSGATAVEYGLILALLFLAIVTAVEGIGTEINSTWDDVSSKVADSSAQARGG